MEGQGLTSAASSSQDPNADDDEANGGKGFYISFDNEAPKRPKPPLRTKRSPKKEVGDPTSGHSSASTLDSGRSMDLPDRFGTTTRRASGHEGAHYGADRPTLEDREGSEPIAAKRHMTPDTMAGRKANENSYVYDTAYQQQQQSQPRRHLEDVTNYEPQAMHNLSYGSSPSEYSTGSLQMGHEANGGTGGPSSRSSEGTAKPIIIANSSNDPVSGGGDGLSLLWQY